MVLPVDNASIEDVPLESLPSEISSDLRETAASPGTGSGDSESMSEPQSTEENTATVNPEAPAIPLNHGQHNLVRRLTTKKSELVIIIVATCIALAGLTLSFRAYRLSKEANDLTRKGNAVAEKSYELQLWDDCHDRQDLQNSSLCQSAPSLIRRDVVFGKLQHICGELNKKILSSEHMTFRDCSSIFSGNPMDLWHCAGSGTLNTLVCMVSCHVFALLVLRPVPFRLSGAERHKKRSSFILTLRFYAFVFPPLFLAFLGNLSTGPEGDKAFVFVLVIFIGLSLVVEKLSRRLQRDVQDEEAQLHQRLKHPDLRTLPAVGREASLGYTKLKQRLRTYNYQQDD